MSPFKICSVEPITAARQRQAPRLPTVRCEKPWEKCNNTTAHNQLIRCHVTVYKEKYWIFSCYILEIRGYIFTFGILFWIHLYLFSWEHWLNTYQKPLKNTAFLLDSSTVVQSVTINEICMIFLVYGDTLEMSGVCRLRSSAWSPWSYAFGIQFLWLRWYECWQRSYHDVSNILAITDYRHLAELAGKTVIGCSFSQLW